VSTPVAVDGPVSVYCQINGCCAMDDAALRRLADATTPPVVSSPPSDDFMDAWHGKPIPSPAERSEAPPSEGLGAREAELRWVIDGKVYGRPTADDALRYVAAGRVGVTDEQCVQAIEARNAYLSSPAGKQSGNAIHAMRAALEAALAGPEAASLRPRAEPSVVAGEVVAWHSAELAKKDWDDSFCPVKPHDDADWRPLVYADTAKGAE
jgi:hypothetical protein